MKINKKSFLILTILILNSIAMVFTSCKEDDDIVVTLPVLTTSSISEITETTAIAGGNITADGGGKIMAKGVCWNTSSNPTTADNETNEGNGIESFVSSISGLISGTTYYVRAYAINNSGTVYGNEQSFTTQIHPPIAAFTVNQTSVEEDEIINFTDKSTNSPTIWFWDFGDGNTSTSQNPTHTYLTSGTYTVTLTATNLGGSDDETKTDYIIVSTAAVNDIDGNQYSTVRIGTQVWMSENLKTTHYLNGDAIPDGTIETV
ncbi:MAG: PKD domain-containing protein [bacterium]|nr:PKD domain-containing protein [bacterium]